MSEGQKIPREIVVTMKSENKPEGIWSIIERVSKALSLAAIPLTLGIGGLFIERQLQNQAVKKDYVQIAITILTEPDKVKVDPIIRDWAVDLLNDNSPKKFPSDIVEKLKKGEISLFPSVAKVETTIDKPEVSINPNNGEKLRYRIGLTGASTTISLSCCQDRILWSETTQPSVVEKVLSKDQTDFHSNDETYNFNILSSGDTKYNLVVEHIDASGKVLGVVKDIKGESRPDPNMKGETTPGKSNNPTTSLKTSFHVRLSR